MATIAVYDNDPVSPFIPTTVAATGNINTSFNKLLLDIRCLEHLQLGKSFHFFSFFIYFMKMSYIYITITLFFASPICCWREYRSLFHNSISHLLSLLFPWHRAERRALINPFCSLSATFLSPLIDLNCISTTPQFPFPTETHTISFNHQDAR